MCDELGNPKRLFRDEKEAKAADSLYKVANQPEKKKDKKS